MGGTDLLRYIRRNRPARIILDENAESVIFREVQIRVIRRSDAYGKVLDHCIHFLREILYPEMHHMSLQILSRRTAPMPPSQ